MLDLPSRTWSQGGWRWFAPRVELCPRCPWCFRFSYSQTSDASKDRRTKGGLRQVEETKRGRSVNWKQEEREEPPKKGAGPVRRWIRKA